MRIRRYVIRHRDGTLRNMYMQDYGEGPFARLLERMFTAVQITELTKRKLDPIRIHGAPLLLMRDQPYIDGDVFQMVRVGVKLEQLATSLRALQQQADLFRLLTIPATRGRS
jgi:hypothetical protein